jgi:hypothetical protein
MFRPWLRYYATSRKTAGSIPDEVFEDCSRSNPSSRIMALESTQHLTGISTGIFLGVEGDRRLRMTTCPVGTVSSSAELKSMWISPLPPLRLRGVVERSLPFYLYICIAFYVATYFGTHKDTEVEKTCSLHWTRVPPNVDDSLPSLFWNTSSLTLLSVCTLCVSPSQPTFEWLNQSLWNLVCISWQLNPSQRRTS